MPASIVEYIRFVRVQERRARVRAALSATATASLPLADDEALACTDQHDGIFPGAVARLTTRANKRDRSSSLLRVVSRTAARRQLGPKRQR